MADTINIIVNGTDNASGVLNRVGDSLKGMGTKMMGVGAATTAITAPLALLGAASVDVAGDFEASMNVLSVAAKSSQTSLEDLSAAALAVGADTELVGISASQAGDAMTEMYKAGMTTNQIFGDMEGYLAGTASLSGALRAAIDLAAASELDLAQATDVVNVAMNTFGLSAEDASSIANTLVQTADAGVASVSGLAESLTTVGPVAAAMGIGMDDLNIALSLMASRGIEGAEAGTQLKSMLLNMQRDTSDVVGLWNALGVSMYDATGTMKALPVIMAELETAMAGMTQEQRNAAIQTLAGTYGLNAMNTLLGEGVTGWDAMSDAVSEAAGVQENAAARTSGWNAALEQLGGVVESIQISVLTPFLQNTLTPLAQKAGELLSRFMELDPQIINMGVIFAALAVAAGPVLLALGTMVTAIGALLSPIGLVVAGVAALGVAWATNFGGIRDATAQVAAFVMTAVQNIRSMVTGASEAPAIFGQAFERAKETARGALDALRSIVDGVLGAIRQFVATHGADIQQTLSNAWTQVARIVDLAVQIVQATVVPIFQGIAQFIREHGEEIQTVLTSAWRIIQNIIQGALNLIEGIFKAVLAVLKGDWKGAWEIIKGTVDRVWDNIVAILEEATTIIVTVIGTALQTIYDWFVEKFEAIKGYLQGIDLADVGRAIIQGLINGVVSMAGALVDAARGVVNSAIQAAKNLLGISSPSRVFMEIGEGTMEGFLLGILGMGGDVLQAVIDVLGEVEGEAAEQAANIARAMETVLGTLVAAIEAVNTLATATLPEVSIGGTVDRIILLLTDIVTRFMAAAGQFEEEGVEAARRLAEAGGAIVGQLQAMIDGFDAVANYRPQVIGPTLNRLFDQLRGTILKLVRIAPEFDGPGLAAATTLATAGGAMVGQLQAMVDGFDAVAAYKPQVLGPTLNTLFDQLKGTILKLVRIAPEFDGPGLAAATALATAGGAIAGQLKAMVDGLTAAATYSAKTGLADAVDALAADLETLVQAMAARFGSLDDATLAAYDAAAAFGQRIGAIVGVISPGVTAIKALAGYVRASNIGRAVEDFALDVLDVAIGLQGAFGAPAQGLLDAYDAAAAFGQRIGAIVGVISPGVTAIKALAGYVRASNIGQAVQAFTVDVLVVAEELRQALSGATDETLAAYDAARAFAERISGVFEAIRPGMDLLRELSRYGGTSNIHGGMQTFLRHVEGVMNTLGTTMQTLSPATVADAVAFSEAARLLVENVRAAMTAASGLANAYDGAFNVAQNWMDGLLDGLRSRLDDLTALMAYIRGMFPSSPAEHGPWRDLPQGQDVAQGWLGGMTAALNRTSELAGALGGVRGMFNGGPGAGLQPAYATAGVQVTINVQGAVIREDADIERLANRVGDVIARQAGYSRRLGQTRA